MAVRYCLFQTVIRVFSASIFLLLVNITAFSRGGFVIKPPAPWVKPLAPTVKQTAPEPSSGTGSSQILYDRQINVGERAVERFYHSVSKVETPAGLDDLSQLRFYFEPSYQTLTIHFVRLQRGTQTIDALRPNEVKLIQQEDELDQRLFNGSQEAVIFLNDLRVGDTIEYAYTITGDNPVLGGRYADSFYLAGSHPINELALRLVWPSSRSLAIKTQNTDVKPTQQSLGANTEYLWSRTNVPAIIEDDETPDSFDPFPSVSLSEFATWKAVVDWALPMYRPTRLTVPELRSKIEQWKKSSALPEQQVTAALRFVQDEVRYLGIELGRYSHQPTPPDKVFARRFGDCKDKSLLLSSILTELGVESWPALVNSRRGESLDNLQPTPFAFDHVIVYARINGQTYWLDPTVSYQRGSLANYYSPPFARALVLHENNESLERIPAPAADSGATDTLEVYSRERNGQTVSLNVTTVYTGSAADSMRYDLSTQSLAELSKDYVNFYADLTPSIKTGGLPVVEDDSVNNKLVIKEKYSIVDFWVDNKHRFLAHLISAELGKPRVSQRTMPLKVNYPLSISHTIRIDLGTKLDVLPEAGSFADEALRFDYHLSQDGNIVTLRYQLKTLAQSVPVEKIQNHLAILDKAQDYAGLMIPQPQFGMGTSRRDSGSGLGAGAASLVGGLLVGLPVVFLSLAAVRHRRRKNRLAEFKRVTPARPGTTRDTAMNVSSEAEVESTLRSFQCDCGHNPYQAQQSTNWERFVYDGDRFVGVRCLCGACRRNNDLYVRIKAPISAV